MNHYEQRKRKFLQDSEVTEGYREMATELQLVLPPAKRTKQEDDQNNQASSSRPLTPESSILQKRDDD